MVADVGIGEDELVIEYKVRGGGVRGGGWGGELEIKPTSVYCGVGQDHSEACCFE